jgi:hypothetical protein
MYGGKDVAIDMFRDPGANFRAGALAITVDVMVIDFVEVTVMYK